MSELQIEISNGVAALTIHRPEQRNALTPDLMRSMSQAVRDAGKDSKVRVITLTGSGDKVFCAGADLKAAADRKGPSDGSYRELLLALHGSRKPTVALARGHVLAGGFGLVLACDFALACDDVSFSLPEIGVGMFPMMVFGLLRRTVPRRRALEMAFLGEKFSAAQACQDGVINQACARAEFETRAQELIEKLTAKSSAILGLGKEAILETEDLSLEESLARLEQGLASVMKSQDSREGIAAFVEKRKPVWSDR